MDYVVEVYQWCLQLPKDERYNLTDQLKRACTSVPLNIAEGAACETNGDFARFLGYSYRSLKESVTCLELCERLYPSLSNAPTCLINEAEQLAKMTRTLIQRLKPPFIQET
ncbi:MAG: four helix bundle protein [Acidobacteria bacterium]|nr:four helix bundle protein [Acidobacteriota bacterium]